MGRRFLWALAFVLTLGSCTGDTTDASTSTSTATSSTSTSRAVTTTTTTPTTPGPITSPGRLAVIDAGGDIVVMDPDGSNPQAITQNGGSENPAIYMQPVWSPDATTLAWGQTTGTGFGVGISRPGSDLITTLTTPNLPFYTYWSPSGRYLGVLHNGTSGVQFQIADIEQETTELLDEDSPFYFSWSPEGDRVVTHAGAGRVETIDPDGERTELEPTTGNYLAPQWTLNGVFHVVEDQLVLEDGSGARTPVVAVAGLTVFVANPQGTHLAVQATGGDGAGITASTEEFPTATAGAVVVVDVDSSETDVIHTAPALGFFWSADGGSLLALTASEDGIVPTVWTVDGGQTEYTPFRPPASMLQDTFPFFPQYAQSVSFWAPDSSAFAFAGAVEGENGVWVQTIGEGSPTRVSDGTWVAWSPPDP